MKWKHYKIFVILILSISLVCGCMGSSQGILAISISETPENFVHIFIPHLFNVLSNILKFF